MVGTNVQNVIFLDIDGVICTALSTRWNGRFLTRCPYFGCDGWYAAAERRLFFVLLGGMHWRQTIRCAGHSSGICMADLPKMGRQSWMQLPDFPMEIRAKIFWRGCQRTIIWDM